MKKIKDEVARLHLSVVEIAEKSSVKDVGLILNSDLQWTDHIDFRIGKSVKALFLQRQNTSSVFSIGSIVHRFVQPSVL